MINEITDIQYDIIIGSMLGDGSIKYSTRQKSIFRKSQCSVNFEYLNWMFYQLAPFSSSLTKRTTKLSLVHKNHKIVGRVNNGKTYESYELSTVSNSIFDCFEQQWYLRNSQNEHVKNSIGYRIKCVPETIEISPLCLAIWFMDDGSNNSKNNTIRLCTNSFTREEVEFLKCKLKNTYDFKSNIYPDDTGPILTIHARSYIDFIEVVRPYVIWDCFSHKIDISKFKPLGKYVHSDVSGVRLSPSGKKWHAYITINNKSNFLGSFLTKEDAIQARKEAESLRLKEDNCPRQFLSYVKCVD